METLFNQHDTTHCGSLNVQQLLPLLKELGHPMMEDDARELIQQVDTNGNELLELDEFLQMIKIFKDMAAFRLGGRKDSTTDGHIRKSNVTFTKFLPDIYWRWAWDSFFMLVCAYVWVSTTALYLQDYALSKMLVPWDIAASLFIAIEMGIQFRTSFHDGQKMTQDGSAIARKYLSSWFVPDLITLLPLRLFSTDYTTSLVLAHFRLIVIFRMNMTLFGSSGRIPMTRFYIYFHYLFVPFYQQFVFFACCVHTCAIVWFRLYDETRTYSACVYMTMYIFAAVGYGDIEPYSTKQRWFSNFLVLMAMMINGLVIGSVVSFLATGDVEDMRRRRLVETLAVLQFFDVPTPLQEEILQFQNHLLQKDVKNSFGSLVESLPLEIQSNLSVQFKIQLIKQVPFLSTAHKTVMVTIAKVLEPIISLPEEFLALAGEEGDEMFFINYGFMDVLTDSGLYHVTLASGAHFGASVLISDPSEPWMHEFSAKSLTYVELLVLTRKRFMRVLEGFPKFQSDIEEMVLVEQQRQATKQNAAVHITVRAPSNAGLAKLDGSPDSKHEDESEGGGSPLIMSGGMLAAGDDKSSPPSSILVKGGHQQHQARSTALPVMDADAVISFDEAANEPSEAVQLAASLAFGSASPRLFIMKPEETLHDKVKTMVKEMALDDLPVVAGAGGPGDSFNHSGHGAPAFVTGAGRRQSVGDMMSWRREITECSNPDALIQLCIAQMESLDELTQELLGSEFFGAAAGNAATVTTTPTTTGFTAFGAESGSAHGNSNSAANVSFDAAE